MKRLDRLKQWAGERMGGEVKTTVSDDFKSMEAEMQLRHEGMEKLHHTMGIYVKSLSKRREADDKEKMLPTDVLSHAMIAHGEDFEGDSVFGNCLTKMGQANEKVGRIQDTYVTKATETWLESLERSLAQMKEYQAARKRLESRRLAYDATLTKMQKQKREDFRVEEELRAQRVKYEESNEDVLRRMADIQEAETDSVAELTSFMEAELEYHERCREVLLNLKRQWPVESTAAHSRINTAKRAPQRSNMAQQREESPPPPPQPERVPIRSRINSQDSNHRSTTSEDRYRRTSPEPHDRPIFQRTNTNPGSFEGPTTAARRGYVAEPQPIRSFRSTTPQSTARPSTDDLYEGGRYSQHGSGASSPDRHYYHEGVTLATAHATHKFPSRTPSNSNLTNQYNANGARGPPPPAPRPIGASGKKPPPPPPPKRSALSARD